jgi:hypothetical protein
MHSRPDLECLFILRHVCTVVHAAVIGRPLEHSPDLLDFVSPLTIAPMVEHSPQMMFVWTNYETAGQADS